MARPLNDFIQRMTTNQIRTQNMWEMTVTTGFADIDEVLEPITMYAEGFEAPTRTTTFNDVGFKGYMIPIPAVEQMGTEHTFNVRADADGEIRRAFLAWQGKTWNPDIAGGSVFEGDRRANVGSIVRLHLLSHDMQTVSEVYKLVGVRVGEVGALAMSNNEGSPSVFSVTLRSIFWTIENIKNGAFKDQK